MNAKMIADHIKKYLVIYVILVILIALPIGYYNAAYFKSHKDIIKDVILSLAIGTIFPSMIQLRSEKLRGELLSKFKEVAIVLTISFVITPLLAMLFASRISDKVVGIGYVAANAVPASSASVAYVMLAGGNIELATVLIILSVFIALIAAPTYVALYAQSVHVGLPITILAKSIAVALLFPLVLGQIVRHYFIVRRAKKVALNSKIELRIVESEIMKKINPYLSICTAILMLALIGILIANKAKLLISNPSIALYIISAQLTIYAIIIPLLIALSKALGIRYEDHMAMMFISLTKNQSVAAAMTVLAIGPNAAIPAAIIPAIQPLVATPYISISHYIRKILGTRGEKTW